MSGKTTAASSTDFSREQADALLADVFAPWVQDLALSVERLSADGALLKMPFSERLCREGGVVCGQALMALADTAMVFAVSAASGRYRLMTTVDMSTHMMRPLSQADVMAEATVLRLGRSMAFGQIILRAADDPRPAATATTAYALLPDA